MNSMSVGPELIALDATGSPAPGGQRLDALVAEIRAEVPVGAADGGYLDGGRSAHGAVSQV